MLQTTSVLPTPASSLPERLNRRDEQWYLFDQLFAAAVLGIPALAAAFGIVLLCLHGINWVSILVLVFMYGLTGFGMTIGYHRLGTHNSFQTPRLVRAFFAVLGSFPAAGPMFYWIAIHRRHHAHTDQPGDPTTPVGHGSGLRGVLQGLWYSQVGWFFTLRPNLFGPYALRVGRPTVGSAGASPSLTGKSQAEEGDNEPIRWERYIPDLMADPLLRRVNNLYFVLVLVGLALPGALAYALTGSWTEALLGFFWGGLVRLFLAQQVTSLVASLSHVYGSAPFQTGDASKNSFACALITLGDGWHNNHHAFPTSAWHGLRWWQIDMSGWVIAGLKFVGLAWDVKRPHPRAMKAARKKTRSARTE
jgi:stearoyl-CoA desaturase (delta-9 desaturase)